MRCASAGVMRLTRQSCSRAPCFLPSTVDRPMCVAESQRRQRTAKPASVAIPRLSSYSHRSWQLTGGSACPQTEQQYPAAFSASSRIAFHTLPRSRNRYALIPQSGSGTSCGSSVRRFIQQARSSLTGQERVRRQSQGWAAQASNRLSSSSTAIFGSPTVTVRC